MKKYYEVYKTLILATTLTGVYFPSIEKIYGDKRSTKFLGLASVLPALTLPVYWIAALKYVVVDEDDVGNKMYGYNMLLFSTLLLFSFFCFYYYRDDFVTLFELWDSMFQEDFYSEDLEELLAKNRKVTNKWLSRSIFISIFCSVTYCTVVFFNSNKQLNHPSGFPYRNQSPDFEMVNTMDLIVCIFGFPNMVSFDSMTMTFLSLEEAQLIHLKRSLAKILDTLQVTETGEIRIQSGEHLDSQPDVWKIKMGSEEVERKLRIWITQHHQLLRFHREFLKVFTVPICAKFLIFVLMICFTCFLMLAGKFSILEMIFANLFCMTTYAVFYANIMFADSILEEASSVFADAFEKSWYLYPKNLTDAFHIIQMNSYRPLQYMAFKRYPLCSNSFLKILSSAYSLFTFLLQTNRKKIKTLEFAGKL